MEIRPNQEALESLVAKLRKPKEKPKTTGPKVEFKFDDSRLIDKILESQNGAKILSLLNGDHGSHASQSEADQALCNHLAFWTGKDADQMDRIFRRSGLLRDKWDKKHYGDGRTYGEATIQNAIDSTTETYKNHEQTFKNRPETGQKRAETDKKPKGPRGLTLEDLQKTYSSTPEWLWRQHFAKGMPSILNGREGLGKTSIALQASKEILSFHKKGGIVWLATEGAVSDTVNKMVELELSDPRFVIGQKSDGSFKWDLYLQGDRKEFEILLNNLNPILAVFIDSIRGMSRLDDNDAGNGHIMQAINAIACDKYGAALVYLDHFGKGKKDNLLDRAVGTTAKTSSVRAVLSVLPVSKYKRRIAVAKANISTIGGELESLKVGQRIIISEPEIASDDTMLDRAEEFLIGIFSEEATLRARDVYSLGEIEGISEHMLKKAKSLLGIKSSSAGPREPWIWKSPF